MPLVLSEPSPLMLLFSVIASLGVVMEDPYWQGFMEQAVRLIYFLAESPDQLCSRLLQRSARLLMDQITEGGEVNKDASQMQDGSQESSEQGEQGERSSSTKTMCNLLWCSVFYYDFITTLCHVCPVCLFLSPAVNCVCLAQLLALCGCVAFWQVSHLERSVSAELRRRRGEKEEREEKEKGPSSKAKVMYML